MAKSFDVIHQPRRKDTANAMFEFAQFAMERYRMITGEDQDSDFPKMHAEFMERVANISAGLAQLALLQEIKHSGGLSDPTTPTPLSRKAT